MTWHLFIQQNKWWLNITAAYIESNYIVNHDINNIFIFITGLKLKARTTMIALGYT